MRNKIILTTLILSIIALVFSGCGGGNPVTPPVPEPLETIIPDTTKVIEEETIQEIASVTEDQSIIIFEKSTPQLEELSPGDIIVMGVTEQTPYGLLRKVKTIIKGGKDGNEVVVETEFASLEEAIEQGSFEFDISLEPEDIEKSVFYPEGIRLVRDKFEGGYKFSYTIDEVLCGNNLVVDGELSFNYNILLNGTIGFFKLKTLEFKNTVESKAEFNITLTDSFSVGDLLEDNPKTIFTILFKTITIWVSYVPIVLKPQIDINVGLDGELFTELTTGITISQEDEGAYVAGIKFDNGIWQEIKNEPVFTFEYREPSLSAEAKIKAYAGPQLELMLYGFVGPHCNIYGYLDFMADIWDDPWWELYGGLEVAAGLDLEIITKIWSAVYSSPEFTIFNINKLIAQADGPFGGINHAPVISSLTANPSSIDTNQTTTITCTASDEDVGDTLTYTWIKTGGTFEGSTSVSTITWRAPSTPGNYIISCEVSDGEEMDSKSVDIEVTSIAGSQYVIQWSNAESNGWANPLGEGEELITSTAYDYNSDIYLSNHPGKKHMGTDIIGELDGNVYSIADGTIVKVTRDYSSTYNQSVVIIKHTNSNNEDFFAIYGHVLARGDLEVNSEIEVGEKMGIIKKAGSPVHLHFGINLSSEITDFMFTNSDGEWGWGRIPAFANPSDYGWVDPIDYLNTYLPLTSLLASLTPEEIELIRKWGFGGDDIVRRWPDGHIDVYDETNYTRIQDVLNEWNEAIGGTVIFHLSNDPNSPVKVKFDPDISQDLAGQYLVYCSDDDYEFYRADVNIQKNYLDSLDSDTKYCLYLWLFSGVAGFNVQADVDPNPFKEWWNFDNIPDDVKTMLHGLYKVPCGYKIYWIIN